MQAELVDPRYVTVECDRPRYRVDFWAGDSASYEWRLTGADDVAEVLRWAEAHRDGRTFVLYAEYDCGGEIGLTRLLGTDPTVPTETTPPRPDQVSRLILTKPTE